MSATLEDILVTRGRLSQSDLSRARHAQEHAGGALDSVLVQMGLISERHMAEALGEAHGVPLVGPADYPIQPLFESQVSAAFLRQAAVIPLRVDGDGALILAMADPEDEYTLQALRFATGHEVRAAIGLRSDIEAAFDRLYGGADEQAGPADEGARESDVEHLRDLASEAPVVRLVNALLSRALEAGASDIHLEPFEDRLAVRLRIDGVLQEVESPPASLASAAISRVKILARLDIAERRLPQDGRIQQRIQGRSVDFRISTVPTMYGESLVMRILDRSAVALDLHRLGFGKRALEGLRRAIAHPHGIVLVTGPTGSGKTTTLYAALRELNTPEVKILTVEDPVEYQLDGINQVQVSPKIELSFARALRAFLRQDPDIILVGEMRDRETASIAIQSALTGHLVLSTLHTNDAASAVTRLLDMGIEDYLITSTVSAVLAQRLVRVLCSACREPYTADPALVGELGLETDRPVTFWRAAGCDDCLGSGYRGRTAIHELLEINDEIRGLVMRRAPADEVAAAGRSAGTALMFEDGVAKARQGLTSLEEVRRVTQM